MATKTNHTQFLAEHREEWAGEQESKIIHKENKAHIDSHMRYKGNNTTKLPTGDSLNYICPNEIHVMFLKYYFRTNSTLKHSPSCKKRTASLRVLLTYPKDNRLFAESTIMLQSSLFCEYNWSKRT